MEWYEIVVWAFYGAGLYNIGQWVQRRKDRESYTYNWECPASKCGFAVRSNDADLVKRVRNNHTGQFHDGVDQK